MQLKRKVNNSKLKRVMKETNKFRIELGKKTGITASSAEIVREEIIATEDIRFSLSSLEDNHSIFYLI